MLERSEFKVCGKKVECYLVEIGENARRIKRLWQQCMKKLL